MIFFRVVLIVFMTVAAQAQLEVLIRPDGPAFIYADSTLNTNVFVKNNSDQFINITRIEPSCGCVKVTVENLWLSPNEIRKIKIAVVPPFSKNMAQSWYFRIFTNANNNSTTIVIKTYIVYRHSLKHIAQYIAKFIKVCTWTTLF
ncbi:DUF1573 domain-containing protein [Candidatus Uabimicrobium sp. HlEnr_7]|uniref:DUF1573 domain-containing protein n=1 Tax=Candidatus Uabimicrobium helgolandensis TaxID=3095367 RepID=UPI0035583993